MRLVLVVVLGLIAGIGSQTAWVAPAWAETPAAAGQADRDAIQDAIRQQLDAFKHDDAGAAFAQASPMIQGMFGTPENFIGMVQHGYPPVYRPRDTRFGALVAQDDQLIQKVEIVGPDGITYLALYTMEKQPDGSWKINGCQLTASESVGA